MLPNFIIIGTARAGSTSIVHYLSEHPDIFLPHDEISFFEEPYYSETYSRDISNLKQFFYGWHGEKAIGIKDPLLILKKESPRLIYKHIPNAKLLLLLRDPVNRAISNYFLFMKMGYIKTRQINKGMLNILKGNYGNYKRTKVIIDYGFYYEQLCRYLKFFNRKQIKIIWFEDIKNNPLTVYKDLLSFLEVDSSFIPTIVGKRINEGVRSLTRIKWLSFANRLFMDYNNDIARTRKKITLKNLFPILLGYLMTLVDRFLLKYIFSNKKPNISPQLIEELSTIYTEDSRRLSQLLNKDLSHWKPIARGLVK